MDNKVDIRAVILVVLIGVGLVFGHSANNERITDLSDPTADQDAATKKYVDDQVIAAGGSSKEQTQDWGWDVGGGTQTLITVTYQDATNDVDFVVDQASIDHDALTNFAANEHFLQANITETGTILSGTWNGTAIGMPYGGTGAASFTDGGVLLGSGANPITAMSVMADGEIIIGDGTTDPTTLAAFTSSTEQLKHEYGGLEADVSAYTNGLYGMITDVTTDIDTSAELASVIGDETGSGLLVFGTSPTILTSINLPSNAVDAAGEIAIDLIAPTHFTHSQDWGDVSTDASGSVALDNDVVAADEIADGDYGDIVFNSGVATLESDTVSTSELVDADYGDFTIALDIATFDPCTVADSEIDYSAVTLADFTDDLSEDSGHTHTGSTISGLDVSDDLNLSAGTNITLSGDTLNVDDAFLLNGTNDTMAGVLTSDGVTITAGNALTLGIRRWDDGSERINGEQVADDTIDDDSLDFVDITLSDFTDDLSEDSGHTHTTTTISGIDISDDTNLSAGSNITLSGDTLNVATTGLTIPTGNSLVLGTTQWDNGADFIDGEQIADDTIDDDSIDLSDITLADFTDDLGADPGHTHTGGSVSGFMLDAGTPADNTLVRFNGTDGVSTQTSGIAVDDSDNMSGIGTITAGTLGSGVHTITHSDAVMLILDNSDDAGTAADIGQTDAGHLQFRTVDASQNIKLSAGNDVIIAGTTDLLWDTGGNMGASGANRPDNVYVKTNVVAGDNLYASDGSAASPSHSFASRTQTGMFFYYSGGPGDSLGFSYGGSKIFEIQATGLTVADNLDITLGGTGTANIDTMTIAGGSITDSTGAISFGNENITNTGIVTAGEFNTTGVGGSDATNTVLAAGVNGAGLTNAQNGVVEFVSDSTHPTPSGVESMLVVDNYIDAAVAAGGNTIRPAVTVWNNAVGAAPTGTKNKYGLFGGMAATMTAAAPAAAQSTTENLYGLYYTVENADNWAFTKNVFGSGTINTVGVYAQARLGYDGKSISGTDAIGKNAAGEFVSIMDGTYASESGTAGTNYGTKITVTDSLTDVGLGATLNSYGVYLDVPDTDAGKTGTFNSYGFYQVETGGASDGNIFASHSKFGDTSAPLEDVHAADTVRADTAFNLNGTDGVSGTLELDDGGTEKITLVFTGGILTSRTVAATTGSVLADWTD